MINNSPSNISQKMPLQVKYFQNRQACFGRSECEWVNKIWSFCGQWSNDDTICLYQSLVYSLSSMLLSFWFQIWTMFRCFMTIVHMLYRYFAVYHRFHDLFITVSVSSTFHDIVHQFCPIQIFLFQRSSILYKYVIQITILLCIYTITYMKANCFSFHECTHVRILLQICSAQVFAWI